MRKLCKPRFGIVAALVVSVSVGASADPQRDFDAIYAKDLKAAVTPSQKVEFARQLVKDAAALNDSNFQAMLLDRAYELASIVPAGYPVAVQAMDDLAAAQPAQKFLAGQKSLAVVERQCRLGTFSERRICADGYLGRLLPLLDHLDDETAQLLLQKSMPIAELAGRGWVTILGDHSREIRTRLAAAKTAAVLKQKVQQNPRDAASASELVNCLTFELDKPFDAIPYLKPEDTTTKRLLENASNAPQSLSADELWELWNWYKSHAGQGDRLSKAVSLRRAEEYLKLYLQLHSESDVARLNASVALEDVLKEISSLHEASSPIINLSQLIDPAKDTVSGRWSADGGIVTCAPGNSSRIGIPYLPPAEYNFKMTFDRSEPAAVFVTFPFGNRSVTWLCSCWDSVTSGFEMIGGKDARANPTMRKLSELNKPGPHVLEIRVRSDHIAAYVDGSLEVRYMTDGSDLSSDIPPTGPYSLSIAVGNASSSTMFSHLELFEVSGKGRQLAQQR